MEAAEWSTYLGVDDLGESARQFVGWEFWCGGRMRCALPSARVIAAIPAMPMSSCSRSNEGTSAPRPAATASGFN